MTPTTVTTKEEPGRTSTRTHQLRNNVSAATRNYVSVHTLASVGHILTNQSPDFDSRTYGYAKLSDLMAATTLFDLERRSLDDGKQGAIYIRDKRRRQPGNKSRPAGTG